MGELKTAASESKTGAVDIATVLMRTSAANSTSIAGRQETINFSRQYANIVPKFEKAWSPEPMPSKKGILDKINWAWLLYGDGQAAVESMTCGFERTAEVSKSRGYRNIPRARCHSHA